MPRHPCDFEIPDDWLAEAGMIGFVPSSSAYRSTVDAVPVPVIDIEPPFRMPSCPKDWRGFDRGRLVHVLREIASGAEIYPVPLVEFPEVDIPLNPLYRYRIRDGFHRFYATIAAGFDALPGVING